MATQNIDPSVPADHAQQSGTASARHLLRDLYDHIDHGDCVDSQVIAYMDGTLSLAVIRTVREHGYEITRTRLRDPKYGEGLTLILNRA